MPEVDASESADASYGIPFPLLPLIFASAEIRVPYEAAVGVPGAAAHKLPRDQPPRPSSDVIKQRWGIVLEVFDPDVHHGLIHLRVVVFKDGEGSRGGFSCKCPSGRSKS